jgi:hypothetical protein
MPHDGSRIEPRLDLDDLDRQVSRTAVPRERPDPDEFDRQLAQVKFGAKIAPNRPAPEPEFDADTIRFEPPEWTRGERPRPSMMPALLMLTVLGAAASAAALYLS